MIDKLPRATNESRTKLVHHLEKKFDMSSRKIVDHALESFSNVKGGNMQKISECINAEVFPYDTERVAVVLDIHGLLHEQVSDRLFRSIAEKFPAACAMALLRDVGKKFPAACSTVLLRDVGK